MLGARATEIVRILSANGFEFLVDAAGFGRYSAVVRWGARAWPGPRPKPTPASGEPLPVRLRIVLEQLGPTFVKGGQLLALRPDLLPPAYGEELRKLQAEVSPFPAAKAREIVESELGMSVGEAFHSFEDEPFAAASLSQVHRAVRHDGRVVAVKVQRPDVEAAFDADLALLALGAARLQRRVASSWSISPVDTIAELDRWSRRELDFRGEARTAQAVARMFADDDDVVIPEVDTTRTTRRVLTMDLIEGVHPTSAQTLRSAGIDVDRVVETGTHAMVRQVFGFGLFHADPHPGNILVQPGGQVAFLDFGLFGRLDGRQRRHVGLVVWAMINGDLDQIADLLLRLAVLKPGADVRGFRDAISDLLNEWLGEAQRTSIPRLLLRALGSGGTHGVTFSADLVLLARALISLEATVVRLQPGAKLTDRLSPSLPELKSLLLPSVASLKAAFSARSYDYLALALDLPEVLANLVPELTRPGVPPPAPPRPPPPPSRASKLGSAAGRAATTALAAGIGALAAQGISRWGNRPR